jgi:hypothetical protein
VFMACFLVMNEHLFVSSTIGNCLSDNGGTVSMLLVSLVLWRTGNLLWHHTWLSLCCGLAVFCGATENLCGATIVVVFLNNY